jgi:hypothetical protein
MNQRIWRPPRLLRKLAAQIVKLSLSLAVGCPRKPVPYHVKDKADAIPGNEKSDTLKQEAMPFVKQFRYQ